MKRGKYEKVAPVSRKKRGLNTRIVTLMLALALLVGGVVGGTIAWLTAESETVTNTFTDSDINITLEETKKDFKMIPGWTIDKDPVVTVEAGSEDCWVFIKVDESENLKNYIAYAIDSNNWTTLESDVDGNKVTGVYYCYAKDITADRMIKVLGEGPFTDPMGTEDNDDITVTWGSQQVGVKPSVTKEMMDALNADGAVQPTLTFQAAAVQLYKDNNTEFTAAEAYAKVVWPTGSSAGSGT